MYRMVFFQWPIFSSVQTTFPQRTQKRGFCCNLFGWRTKASNEFDSLILKPQKKRFLCTRPTWLQWENVWSLSPILNMSFFCIFEQPFHPSVGLLSQTDFLIQDTSRCYIEQKRLIPHFKTSKEYVLWTAFPGICWSTFTNLVLIQDTNSYYTASIYWFTVCKLTIYKA